MRQVIQVKAAPPDELEPPVFIEHLDALLIKRISETIGKIEAIRVTRWLTKKSLRACKDFVESLS